MHLLVEEFGVSQRRACCLVDQPRSTQRLEPVEVDEFELEVRSWLVQFSKDHPRWGWKKAYHQMRREGWIVNKKRIQRLWRLEGLKVPYAKRKKPLRGVGQLVGQMCPIAPNVVWAFDFQFDQTTDSKMLKIFNCVDEFTRECLALEVERHFTAHDVVAVLDGLLCERGAPCYVRCDNGPEFVADAMAKWCEEVGATTVFFDPGSPWQNAWVESFNSRLRDERLNGQLFDSLLEAQVNLADWREEYNHERLHSSLGYRPPAEFVTAWKLQHQKKLSLAVAH